jgi:hypothetical protein
VCLREFAWRLPQGVGLGTWTVQKLTTGVFFLALGLLAVVKGPVYRVPRVPSSVLRCLRSPHPLPTPHGLGSRRLWTPSRRALLLLLPQPPWL